MNTTIIPSITRKRQQQYREQQQKPPSQNANDVSCANSVACANSMIDCEWHDNTVYQDHFITCFLYSFAYLLSRRGNIIIKVMKLDSQQNPHSTNSSIPDIAPKQNENKAWKQNDKDKAIYQEFFIHFRILIDNLSLQCPNVNDWFGNQSDNGLVLSRREQRQRIEGLQSFGILLNISNDDVRKDSIYNDGEDVILIDDDTDKSEENQNSSLRSSSDQVNVHSLSSPKFQDLETMQDTASRIQPFLEDSFKKVCQNHLFSTYSDHNGIPPSFLKMIKISKLRSRNNHDVSTIESIYKCISYNEDLVRQIFSFLGYKRLVKMRYVCPMWKIIADQNALWYVQYQSRYDHGVIIQNQEEEKQQRQQSKKRFLENDSSHCKSNHGAHTTTETIDLTNVQTHDNIPNNIDLCDGHYNWKSLFQKRWQLERDVRHRYCMKDGSKWQICPIVDCMKILKSNGMAKKHMRTHQGTSQKKRKRRCKPKSK
jgi:F-box domain